MDPKVRIDRKLSKKCGGFNAGHILIIIYLLIVPITIAVAAYAGEKIVCSFTTFAPFRFIAWDV